MKTVLKLYFAKTLIAFVLLSAALSAPAATTRYVNLNNTNPVPPFTSWSTAATNIQNAVDVAEPGDEIVVTNGVYQTGARAVNGMNNRVAVTKAVTVRSLNGPDVTTIMGYQMPGMTNGPEAVRCVYLADRAVLAGFILTNGATQTSGDYDRNQSGGGAWCEGLTAVVSNCLLTGNSAYHSGGGTYIGTLKNCTLTGNSASEGGGTYAGTLSNCVLTGNLAAYGGGTYWGTLNKCTLTANSADHDGGAAYFGTLINCTITGNIAGSDGGGAAYGTVNNCTLTGNIAPRGGGAYSVTLNNCVLTGNSAGYGGGADASTLNNSTITGNSADHGGGAYDGMLNNCIVYYNRARYSSANYDDYCTLNFCCTAPLPAGGTGNLVEEPQLVSTSHLSASSPCIGRGHIGNANGADIDGEPWANPPAIGCDEYWSGAVTGALSVAVVAAYTNVAVGFRMDFQAVIGGRVNASRWDFGDGVVVSNRPWASHAWAEAGNYVVDLRAYNESNPAGVAATITVQVVQEEHFVSLTSANPVAPYDSWAAAATNIQDAVDAAVLPGASVWVSNGVHQTGARPVYGMSNRLAVTKPLTVRSVNGPAATQIVGYQVPLARNGPAAVRCVYLTHGAVLAGFTLTNGATQVAGDYITNRSGGGVWCEGVSTVVSNCVLTGNSAFWNGGGACCGKLIDCVLTDNSATYGGATAGGTLNNCSLTWNSANFGGGAYDATLNYCTFTGNSANYGGGAYYGTLNNCTLRINSASYDGGGGYYGTLNNCSLTGNSVRNYGGGGYRTTLNNCVLTVNSAGYGGGTSWATLNNCIVYYNDARYGGTNYIHGTLNYSCTTPLPEGTGNLTNAPLFVDTNGWTNLRLQPNSPCINAGDNSYAPGSTDLDGRPRIVSGSVDMGAYEYQGPGMGEFIGRLQQYGLPTDGSADLTDPDGDGLNNWQEWRCLTDPTDALSVLRLLTPQTDGTNVSVSWQSVANKTYFLERSTGFDTNAPFVPVASNIVGQAGTMTFTDTNAASARPHFYRVGVQ